jgi:hypothetical protein
VDADRLLPISGFCMVCLIRFHHVTAHGEYARRRPHADKVALWIGVFLAGIITKLLLSAQDPIKELPMQPLKQLR